MINYLLKIIRATQLKYFINICVALKNMKVEYVVTKLKKMTGIDDLKFYEDDIKKLVDSHNEGNISLYTRMKLLSEQISLGLDSPYERIIELIKYGKNSSSLHVYKLRYGDIEGSKRYKEKTNKTTHTLESYIKKYGDVDGPIKFKEYCKSKSMSLEMCIKRHGEIDGPKIYEKYWKTTGFGMNERAFKKRYGDEWEKHFEEYKVSQGKRNTLEWKIKKYGEEEGTKRYKESNLKKSKSQSKEFLIKKLLENGASFQEIQEEISNRWNNTSLKSFISRYGEIEGEIKYNEYVEKHKENNPLCLEYYKKKNIPEDVAFDIITKIQWDNNKNISRCSKESLKYLDILNIIFKNRGYKSQYKKSEFGIKLTLEEYKIYKKNRFFFYDFFVPDMNLILEYHGERFHDDIEYESTIGVTENDLLKLEYNYDFYKKWIAESRGYKVLIIRSWCIQDDLNQLFNVLEFTEEEKCKFL